MNSLAKFSFTSAWLLLFAVLVYGQEHKAIDVIPPGPVSQACMGCICEAASGCNLTIGCDGSVCGPFRITWPFWIDSGKPTLNKEANPDWNAYANCCNDPFCAARSVQNYMTKYNQDCNGDNKITCEDYMRIHRLGSFGCTGPLDQKYEYTYNLCMKVFG